jgi:predicted Zn finger-like uncharacterized protein
VLNCEDSLLPRLAQWHAFCDDVLMNILHLRGSRHPSESIRRVGFRKWYERELLSSHGYMILAFLSLIAVIASFEAFRESSVTGRMMDVLFVIVSTAIGLWALRRYLFLLMRAEELAMQASCGDCGTYGRFRVVGDDQNRHETQVRCSKCEHLWTIST